MLYRKFFQKMDSSNVFRISVCLLPGLLLSKLGTQLNESQVLTQLGTIGIFAGAVIWLVWSRVRGQMLGREDFTAHVDLEASSIPNATYSMDQLISLCGGDAKAAMQAIQVEVKLHPDVSASAAITKAAERKIMEAEVRDRY